MDVKNAYKNWADQYDTNQNKTRDLEAIALKETLVDFQFDNCLEIGCGTGKNTSWLLTKVKHITAIDLSMEMLARAKEKINANHVDFIQSDITKEWNFSNKPFDLVTYSLVLEHIENLNDIFCKTASAIIPNGYVYIGELHPFKQYTGTKARFDSEEGQQIVNCFNHNISDFIQSALQNNFEIVNINEHFDNNDRSIIPRILTILLKKI
jgi:ubiquinone/menaquinone biosynthesis C-methylase UbiE